MSRGSLLFAAFAGVVSFGCVRLGVWQLERLGERQDRNSRVLSRLLEPSVPLTAIQHDTGVRFRRAHLEGRYDFEREFVLTSRTRLGAPGVHIITPVRVAGTDTAVLVNRGWVYSPDGMRTDLSLHREDSLARVEGYVERYAPPAAGPASTASVERAVRRLDRDSIQAMVPYPLAPALLVQRADSGEVAAVRAGRPVRVDPPPLDEGPHRAYAIQWFAFALVGVVGTVVILSRERQQRRREDERSPAG